MVKLTTTLVEKKCLQKLAQKSLTKELDKNCLKKLTHLFMNEQSIDELGDFSECKNLKIIYLQKNSIEKIENLEFATNLTHLYLQHNELNKIENLESLVNLKKLYLGYNNISVVEGLEKLTNLSELHIEKQRLASGERLCFELRTARSLSGCLTHLNVSNNKLTSLNEIKNFTRLITLEAKENCISDIENLTETVSTLISLKNLFIQGNPVTKVHNYYENLIANSDSLVMIDMKYVTESSRVFLQNFKIEKLHHSERKIESKLSEEVTSSLNLPPAMKDIVSRAMMNKLNAHMLFPVLDLGDDMDDNKVEVFPSWKSASSVQGVKNNHIIPRPFWKNKENPRKKKVVRIENPNFSFPPPPF
ncbi:hypothetical protein TKK_0018973 [Trichogramma kaykai]|uniref:Protein phosphatase 1 regulatory subunit 7 n=1 Tax=Trichogramma kaykai TaxID=54128 RepID=A0ABD2VV48_9HYME